MLKVRTIRSRYRNNFYTKQQLFIKLSSLLTSSSLNNLIYNLEDEYNDRQTGKIKITITNNINNYPVYLKFEKNDIYKILGFTFNKNYYFYDNILISENVINLNRESNLFLHSNIIRNKNSILNIGNDVLSVIYSTNTPNFSYIKTDYDLITNMKDFKYQSDALFYLTNEDNEIIDLQGCDIYFNIVFFRYTPNKLLYDKINNYINFNLLQNNIN